MQNTVLNQLLRRDFDHYQLLLRRLYERSILPYCDKYESSPNSIKKENWRQSLGDKRLCSAYRDFFNAELPGQGDWKSKFFEYLLDDTDGVPLIYASLDSSMHPIIRISYAIRLNRRLVACEALAMTAVCGHSY